MLLPIHLLHYSLCFKQHCINCFTTQKRTILFPVSFVLVTTDFIFGRLPGCVRVRWTLDKAKLCVIGGRPVQQDCVEGNFKKLAILTPVHGGTEGKIRISGMKADLLLEERATAKLHLPHHLHHHWVRQHHFHLYSTFLEHSISLSISYLTIFKITLSLLLFHHIPIFKEKSEHRTFTSSLRLKAV